MKVEETIARALGGKRVGNHWLAPCPAHRLPRNQLASPEANPWRPQSEPINSAHHPRKENLLVGGHPIQALPEARPSAQWTRRFLAGAGTTALIQDSTDNVTRLADCVAAAPARTHGHRSMPDRVNQGGHGHG